MNQQLQTILDFIQQNEQVSADQKEMLLKAIKKADTDFSISEFKLERTEKVKRTTAILLEETIEELEQKRKAVEAQNKELEIESSLERVRTVAMSMSKPGDLLNISQVLFKELQVLNFADLRNSIIHAYEDEQQFFLDYDYSDFTGGSINRIPYTGNAIIEKFIADIQQSKDAFSEIAIEGERLQLWRSFRDHNNELPDERLSNTNALYYYFYSIGEAAIGISTFTAITLQEQETLRRFRNVFDLAYQRYADITKAAAQTREAQIELSLERIRAKVTAMKVSKDLLDIVVTMRTEFVALGHEAHYFWHMRWQPDMYEKAMTSGDGARIGNVMTLPRHIHGDIPLIAEWERGTAAHVVYAMDTDAAIAYVVKMIELGDFEQVDPNAPTLDDIRHIGGLTFIMARTTHGEIGFSLPGPVPNPSADAIATLVRFAAVFDLAYRRFEDLKSSEKQIREAQIELALERVRARTMAMQHSDELAEASFVLDSQVRTLGIQTRGCAFNIYGEHESTEWFSSEAGMLPPYNTPREDFFLRAYEAGQKAVPIYIEEFADDECKAHYEYLQTIPVMGDALRGMIAAGLSFPERQIDHATFFKYGYLLFITLEPVPDAHEVFIRFAKVFEQTYTRFLDLKKAEAQALQAELDLIEIKEARKKAEATLLELQATQKQLIQSEKMASLGELTAGIAHEIQNPLNFVNNFSEINNELIDEVKSHPAISGTVASVELAELLNDIFQNNEKINQHGKRADAIVKGMLQHSQSSTGKKEPSDINKLADEYLRLSYHGLRAKDKSFNATLKVDYDESIGNIAVITQDIGRVFLNIFNNAFYAVNDKLKSCQAEPVEAGLKYEPTVSISTKQVGNKLEIKVSDNGNGISSNIIDKIFQPFFTTKPTGQGTGLGLSLSYDIVIKGHGGELKVETKHGEGSTFIIQLPGL